MRVISTLVIALFGGCMLTADAQQKPDISGIQMGMSLDQAKAKIGPGYTFQQPHSDNPEMALIVATKGDPTKKNDLDRWVFETVDGKLAYASHEIFYPSPQQYLNSTETVQRLIQKYGPIRVTSGQAAWAYTSTGAPYPSGPSYQALLAYGKCAGELFAGHMMSVPLPGPFGGVAVPGSFPPNCGISVVSSVGVDVQDHLGVPPAHTALLPSFTMQMVDLNALYQATARSNAAQQQQQKRVQEKAKDNKAPF